MVCGMWYILIYMYDWYTSVLVLQDILYSTYRSWGRNEEI
jgi:hypothetical protein